MIRMPHRPFSPVIAADLQPFGYHNSPFEAPVPFLTPLLPARSSRFLVAHDDGDARDDPSPLAAPLVS